MSAKLIDILVLGGSGFVGSSIVGALNDRGALVDSQAAPRVTTAASSVEELWKEVEREEDQVQRLANSFRGIRCVIVAAGYPDASAQFSVQLMGANALLPLLVAEAAVRAGVERLIHVSSAVVQGDKAILDESTSYRGFSPYSNSKVLAEKALGAAASGMPSLQITVYRPPSVHARDRRVTKLLGSLAMSRWSSVAAPGDQPTPQAHIANVGSAVAFMACYKEQLPPVVMHPWEGLTSQSLLKVLGGRNPILVPRPIAVAVIRCAKVMSRLVPSLGPNVRRFEMVWLGQSQAQSWLTQQGWTPPVTDWSELARAGERQ